MNAGSRPAPPYLRRALSSPIGTIEVVTEPIDVGGGIVAVLWDTSAGAAADAAHNPVACMLDRRGVVDVAGGDHPVLDRAVGQLEEYFAGARTGFALPLAPVGTPFQQRAWQALRAIPYGETISYGAQATELGDARKARAVGAANGQNPIPIVVPCHRVVGSSGKLIGFAGGLGAKAWLLEHERLTLMRAT